MITALQLFIHNLNTIYMTDNEKFLKSIMVAVLILLSCIFSVNSSLVGMCLAPFWFRPYMFTLGSVAGGESQITVHHSFTWACTSSSPSSTRVIAGLDKKKNKACTIAFLRGYFSSLMRLCTMGTSWVDDFVPVSDQRCVCVCVCVLDCEYVRRWCLALCLAPVWLSQRRQGNKEAVQGDSLFN